MVPSILISLSHFTVPSTLVPLTKAFKPLETGAEVFFVSSVFFVFANIIRRFYESKINE
jgi:hypothetical protein